MKTEFSRLLAAASVACALVFSLLVPLKAAHAQNITASTLYYKKVTYNGVIPTDPFNDQQTGSTEGDIVGNPSNPFFYTLFDPGSQASLTDGTFFFRVRLGGDANPPGYTGVLYIGIDAPAAGGGTSPNGNLDLFVGASFSGSAGTNHLGIFAPGNQANVSPSTTSINTTPLVSYTPTASNYNFSPVNSTIAPDVTTNDVGADGNIDYFVTFAIPFQDIVNQLNRPGVGISINENTRLSFVVATTNQGNSLNQDIGGVSGQVSSSATYASLGTISDQSAPSSFIMPEPGTFALMGAPLAGMGLAISRRRRRKAA